jgi:hypothetical protein
MATRSSSRSVRTPGSQSLTLRVEFVPLSILSTTMIGCVQILAGLNGDDATKAYLLALTILDFSIVWLATLTFVYRMLPQRGGTSRQTLRP